MKPRRPGVGEAAVGVAEHDFAFSHEAFPPNITHIFSGVSFLGVWHWHPLHFLHFLRLLSLVLVYV
jgi:hypothetical protein